jgi:hypothetical protein
MSNFSFTQVVEEIKNYVRLRVEHMKLLAIEKMVEVSSSLIYSLIILFLILLALITLQIAIVLFFVELGWTSFHAILLDFLLNVLLLVIFTRKKIRDNMLNRLRDFILSSIQNSDDHE